MSEPIAEEVGPLCAAAIDALYDALPAGITINILLRQPSVGDDCAFIGEDDPHDVLLALDRMLKRDGKAGTTSSRGYILAARSPEAPR